MTTKKNTTKAKKANKIKAKKDSDNSEKEPKSLFVNIDASRIVNPDILLRFIRWTALPKQERNPKLHKEFAKENGIEKDTLTDWKHRVGFWDEVNIHRGEVFHKYVSDYMYGQVKSAKNGSHGSAKLLLEFFENFAVKIKTEDVVPAKEPTQEEREKINNALANIGLASVIIDNEEEDEDEKE